MPTLIAGRTPEKKRSDSRKICPSVIEITFVGMYADDVARLRLDDRQRRQRAAAELVGELARALEQPRVEVEDVAREGLAARRAAQEQRQLPVRVRLLRQVVVDARARARR